MDERIRFPRVWRRSSIDTQIYTQITPRYASDSLVASADAEMLNRTPPSTGVTSVAPGRMATGETRGDAFDDDELAPPPGETTIGCASPMSTGGANNGSTFGFSSVHASLRDGAVMPCHAL